MGSISLRKMGESRKSYLFYYFRRLGERGGGRSHPFRSSYFPISPLWQESKATVNPAAVSRMLSVTSRPALGWKDGAFAVGLGMGVGPLSKGGRRGGKFLGRIGGENWGKGVLVGVGGNLIKGRGKSWLMRMGGEVTGRGQTQFCGGGKKKEFPQTTGK